jgi:hypothetical protein
MVNHFVLGIFCPRSILPLVVIVSVITQRAVCLISSSFIFFGDFRYLTVAIHDFVIVPHVVIGCRVVLVVVVVVVVVRVDEIEQNCCHLGRNERTHIKEIRVGLLFIQLKGNIHEITLFALAVISHVDFDLANARELHQVTR